MADAQKIANAAALDARARPMQRVAAQIGNARVLARDPLPRAMAPLGYPEPHPLGTGLAGVKSLGAHLGDELAALAALVAAQPRELGGERLGGRHLPCLLAIVHHRQRSQSHIHPDRSDARARRLGPRHRIGRNRGEVAARPIAHQCHRAQAPDQRLGAAQLHPAQPGQIHVRPSRLARTARHLLATLIEREAHACLAAAAAKPRVLRSLGEEVRKRPLLVAQHLVERLARQLGKPGRLRRRFQRGELARERDPIQPGLLAKQVHMIVLAVHRDQLRLEVGAGLGEDGSRAGDGVAIEHRAANFDHKDQVHVHLENAVSAESKSSCLGVQPKSIMQHMQRRMMPVLGRELIAQLGSDCAAGPESTVCAGGNQRCYRWRCGSGWLFVKTVSVVCNDRLVGEAAGLTALAEAGALRVPQVRAQGIAADEAFLALEWIDAAAATVDSERRLGEGLAAQHRVTVDQFGWNQDNHIGPTPQGNGWLADWTDFWRERRLRPQLELAVRRGHGRLLEAPGERLLEALDALLGGHRPQPSLLHGDLWGGNWCATAGGEPVIFDPAVYYGDRETDLAMTRLFGGFGRRFYEAYQGSAPLPAGHAERVELYNVYHVLNHANLFGGDYAQQAHAAIRRLLTHVST